MLKNKTHLYFWTTSIVVFVLGLFTYSNDHAFIDFNVHDTYLLIHIFHLTTLVSIVYFALGFCYWLFSKLKIKLNQLLSAIHIMASIGGFICYILVMTFFDDDTQIAETYQTNQNSKMLIILILIFSAFIISQLLFLLNLTISIINHKALKINHKQ